MIHSIDLEQHLLGALIKYPDKYAEIENFIDESDFYADENQTNKTIFLALRQCIDQSMDVDHVILAQRIQSFNISFPQDININDYIYSLSLRAISPNQVISIAQELKKYSIRRSIYKAAQDVAKRIKKIPAAADFEEIIQTADETFNSQMNLFDLSLIHI